jgi:hypothetical protein
LSNYTKSTNFATKDNLSPGDPLKIVRGTEIDTEFNNISTAISTKTDNSAAAITGGSITGITDLAVADGGTGASTAAGGLNNLLPTQTGNANKYLQTDGTNATWDAVSLSTADITGTLPVANGGTGVTSSTGTGNVVLSNSPTLVTPALGTPSALVGTNITGTASGLTAGNVTTNANLTGAVTSVGNATSLGSFTSSQLAGALTDETGSGSAVFATSPTLVTPILGTPTSATLTNATGLPIATGVSGLGTGIATALAVNTGSAGAPVLFNGALGTPSSGTVTNLTGTASININGTVGATTATTGAFTTLSATGVTTLQAGTALLPALTTTGDTNTGIWFPAADTIAASTGGTERLRIDSLGNAGLGVTPSAWSASWKVLEIGSGNAIWRVSGQDFRISSNMYNDGSNSIYKANGVAAFYAQSSGSHQWFNAPSGTAGNPITFTQAMTLDAAGGLKTLNTIGVGNTAPSTSGAGITFPATQSASTNANTLDDYEEGTWTPTDASGAGLSLTNQVTASYTKIGRVVTIRFAILFPTTASVATVAIGGAPFAAANSSYPYGMSIGQTSLSTPQVGGIFGSSIIPFTFGNSQFTNANYSAGVLRASITYETT